MRRFGGSISFTATSTTTSTSSSKASIMIMILTILSLMATVTTALVFCDNNNNHRVFSHPALITSSSSLSLSSTKTKRCRTSSSSRSSSQLYGGRSSWGGDNEEAEKEDNDRRDALALNRKRTDIRNFLTQRAIQSFQFLLESCRDDATVRWLENTYEFHNLENFHGTGAFNLTKYPSWDTILTDMLGREKDVIIIAAKRRGRGQGGWSKNNPYLEERFVEFEIDIDPPSLVSRIVSVREQIAKEWTKDLTMLININEMILKEYTKQQSSERSNESSLQKSKEMDLDKVTGESGSTDEKLAQKKTAYDRSMMQYLGNSIESDDQRSSALRKGSFDLLSLLATQESIHRVLREYKDAGSERDVSFAWLREFYISRVANFFDGSQNYGRADDFLEELLLTSPSMKEIENGKKVGLIDPLRIAEDIIETRTEVYMDWKDIVEHVPETDHMDLRRVILAIQMGKTLDETIFSQIKKESEQVEAFDDLFFQ